MHRENALLSESFYNYTASLYFELYGVEKYASHVGLFCTGCFCQAKLSRQFVRAKGNSVSKSHASGLAHHDIPHSLA